MGDTSDYYVLVVLFWEIQVNPITRQTIVSHRLTSCQSNPGHPVDRVIND
jgi:hypothetical protein